MKLILLIFISVLNLSEINTSNFFQRKLEKIPIMSLRNLADSTTNLLLGYDKYNEPTIVHLPQIESILADHKIFFKNI